MWTIARAAATHGFHMPSKRASGNSSSASHATAAPPSRDRGRPAAHTLLVRLWQEAHADAAHQSIWRGTVSDLHGRQLGSFSSATELAGLLGDLAGLNVLLRVTCTELSREPLPPPTS